MSKTKENLKPDKQQTHSPRKEDSLHRLKEQLIQAKLDGNTDLAKKIQAIIKRLDKK